MTAAGTTTNHNEPVVISATESQLEVWMSCIFGGEDANRSYNLSCSLSLSGNLDRLFLEKSLQELIDRHESLRCTFSTDADGLQVLIQSGKKLDLYFDDLSGLDHVEQEARLEKRIKDDMNTSFDLKQGPLYKLSLLKFAGDKHILTFTVHHIICDGWSMGVFLEELGALYSAGIAGENAGLPPAASLRDYSLDQHKFLQSRAYKESEQFWVDMFSDNIPVLDIPTDNPRPSVRTTKSRRDDFLLDPGLINRVKLLSNRAKCSFAITMRAVFELLIYKLTGNDDIVLGMPAAGQPITGNHNLISHCISLLPIRSKIQSNLSFKEYLQQRKMSTLDAYDHQLFTFGSLLKKLNIPRDPSRVPLVPLVFSLDLGIGENIQLSGLEYELVTNKREYENFEIFVNITNDSEEMTIQWSYNTYLFKPETIRQMMENFESLLYLVVNEEDIRISDIHLKDNEEWVARLSEWNNTSVSYPENTPFFRFVAENARNYPDKIAVRFRGAGLSYGELNTRANQMAGYLRARGIERANRVAISVDRSPEMLICLLAIMKTGAVYIPVDPGYPKTRIEYMLSDSSAKLLITQSKYQDQLGADHIDQAILEEIIPGLAGYPAEDPEVEVGGSDLAYIIYTSGSTGQPKGIAIEHRSILNFLLSMQKAPGMTATDKLLAETTISFDISVLELYLPLLCGGEIVLADTEQSRDGRELLDILRKEKVTIMQATPSTWRMMLELGWEERLPLKALCGGEALPQDLADILLSRVSELWNMYGPTETTVWSNIKKIDHIKDPITIGKPIDNTQIYILDKDLNLLPPGRTGEIYIGGAGLARAYFNKPELSSKSFLNKTFPNGQETRIYRSGDLGKFLPDGEVQCFGRIDNQVKVRGFRIELGAIENALISLTDIKNAVVIAREDQPGDQRLAAYIVPENVNDQEGTGNIAGWRLQLKELLPDYMVPGDFMILEKLPLLPNGKIDRKALPAPGGNREQRRLEAPVTEIEKLVAKVWQQALGLGSVGLTDDFFELGGHSLLAVKATSLLEKELGRQISMTALFRFPVLKQFAYMLEHDEESRDGFAGQQAELAENEHVAPPEEKPAEEVRQGRILPRTELEKLVSKVWVEFLNIDSVELDDDFFELGGHSMIAVRVMARLEKETGQRLPLATLFEHSTVRGMAALLQKDKSEISWDCLVPIKPNGSKMPLYIVHGAGLNVLPFDTLAKCLDKDQPVYGLQAKGLNGIDEPLEKIEDMAAHYIEEILEQNPKGPYALAGFSLGGLIAFDMAKQLRTMGKEVKILAIFDTNVSQTDRFDPLLKKWFKRTKFFLNQINYTFVLLKQDPKRTIIYKSESIKRRLISFYWKHRYGESQDRQGFFGYSHVVDLKNLRASERYMLTPYNGYIDLFRAKKQLFYVDDFTYLGWKPYAMKGVRIHEIPGEHNYIFDRPNVEEFAAVLQKCLDDIVK